jgi:hypothetical protein
MDFEGIDRGAIDVIFQHLPGGTGGKHESFRHGRDWKQHVTENDDPHMPKHLNVNGCGENSNFVICSHLLSHGKHTRSREI